MSKAPEPAEPPFTLLSRMAAGKFDGPVCAWAQGFAALYLKLGGNIALDVCSRIPKSPHKMRLAQRNLWIRTAAKAHRPAGAVPWSRRDSDTLAALLDIFVTRGSWRQWSHQHTPPADASHLDQALFFIARANDGRSLTGKAVDYILRPK